MNKSINPTHFLKVLIFCLVVLTGPSLAKAQSERTIRLSLPDSSAYPIITVFMDPFDRSGNLLENLQADQITLIEDGYSKDLLTIQTLNPGIQLVFAFNFSTPFAIQDISGRSRFDYIKESLLNWAAQPLDTSADDLSLIDNLGLEVIHAAENADWIMALEALAPDLREAVSDFNVLARAIEVASDPVSQPGMKKVVLFFSPQPTADGFEAVDSLISQAKDHQVQVYTIMVASPANFETAGASQFQTLAVETGGKFLTFSGEEPLVDLGQLLQPLRTTYQLQYRSGIVSPGAHTLEVVIASTPADMQGLREFPLDIQPPNAIFITPPRSVTRTPGEETLEGTEDLKYEPTSLTLPLLIEFPDRHPRAVEELIFRVDGEIIETKTSPPFDQVTWALDDYLVSGTHYLSLEVVDSMGLSRLSIETPIEVEVVLPTQNIWDVARKNSLALLGLGLTLLLGLVLFGLVSRGRIQPGNERLIRRFRRPVSQVISLFKGLFKLGKRSANAPQKDDISPYRLIPVNDISQQLFPEHIQIQQPVITLGNAHLKGGIRIAHPSIIPEHARITLLDADRFQITDLGSTAGTWINYRQLSPANPHLIEDGDIINIGEAAFRFQINQRTDSLASDKENSL